MRMHLLGKSGLSVSAIGLGCMPLSAIYGDFDENEGNELIHRAVDLGINFIDTAQGYGDGENESFLGRVIQDVRKRLVIATKFGNIRKPDGSRILDARPERVRPACEQSLKRLRVEAVDLFYLHRMDPRVPIEDTVGAMSRLVKNGKVRHLGLCEVSPDILRRAHAVHPITALQSEYSLWTRDPEDGVLHACRELGIGFVAFSPLGRGFLSGAIAEFDDIAANDRRRIMPRFEKENLKRNLTMLEIVKKTAETKGCTMAQIALAWLLSKQPKITPIPGTKKIAHLESNVQATNLALSEDEIRVLDNAFPAGSVAGERFAVLGEAVLGEKAC